ncbi:hypothetical protein FACS189442_0620 [Spirochaetia bacterium]|nr:hypothetical protein FACS189442_0620 [Spirochaetia bacterium]
MGKRFIWASGFFPLFLLSVWSVWSVVKFFFPFLDHSIAELEERNMSILLPFYVLKLRKQVKAARTGKRRLELSKEMEGIINKLEATAERSAKAGVLDGEDLTEVINQIRQLSYELYRGYTEFKEMECMKEVTVVSYTEELRRMALRRLRREVRKEVRQEVRQEVFREEQREIARKLKARGRPLDEIAEDTGLPRKVVEKL